MSLQYDSDHFAVEYDLEPSDHRSESEHGSHDSVQVRTKIKNMCCKMARSEIRFKLQTTKRKKKISECENRI